MTSELEADTGPMVEWQRERMEGREGNRKQMTAEGVNDAGR